MMANGGSRNDGRREACTRKHSHASARRALLWYGVLALALIAFGLSVATRFRRHEGPGTVAEPTRAALGSKSAGSPAEAPTARKPWGSRTSLRIAPASRAGETNLAELIKVARDPVARNEGGGESAYASVAERVLEDPLAAGALLEDASLNRIPAEAWPSIATALAHIDLGEEVGGEAGAESPSASELLWSAEEAAWRIDIIDALKLATLSPDGQRALDEARGELVLRLGYDPADADAAEAGDDDTVLPQR